MGTCIVISAGDFTLCEIVKKEEDICIAVDGGYLYCKMLGLEPDLVIGDMDSLEEETWKEVEELGARYPERVIVLPAEKNDTDTLAALRLGLEKGYREFHIYGAMGGRLEHTIANIQCLSFLKNQGARGYLMEADSMLTVIRDETVGFRPSMEGFLSLFALGERAEGITITGMKYLLDRAVLTNDFPIGISNEFIGQGAQVTVERGMLLVIVSWPE